MGLFDMLAKQALSGMLSGGQIGSDMLSKLLNEVGGLEGLRGKFNTAGLGEVFESWIGKGVNQAIDPEQLRGVVGSDTVKEMASKVGIDVSSLMPLLSQFLPQVIDQLTPDGKIENATPSADQLQDVLGNVMKGGLGALFGGGKS